MVSLAVRTLHVLTVTVLVGGTVAVWYGYRTAAVTDLTSARRYEWLFWGALGVLVLTGVGNLGALGVPGPTTDWGRTLLVKLVAVLGVAVGSAVRTLVVVRAGERDGFEADTANTALRGTLGRAYGVTAVALLALVVLAEVLAHG
ncbi:CopD family protein [Halomicroarcula sp. F27]|uniref:CopD family protein n=1 Tax=Haloarcula nitratireducens TaxID=2487749 RepID=A0AAW4PI17_9EURY|nr:CopD family protein [Halomicroarcula nitratireducens]